MSKRLSWSLPLALLMEFEVWLAVNSNKPLAGHSAQQGFKLFISFHFLKTCTEWYHSLHVRISQFSSKNTILNVLNCWMPLIWNGCELPRMGCKLLWSPKIFCSELPFPRVQAQPFVYLQRETKQQVRTCRSRLLCQEPRRGHQASSPPLPFVQTTSLHGHTRELLIIPFYTQTVTIAHSHFIH